MFLFFLQCKPSHNETHNYLYKMRFYPIRKVNIIFFYLHHTLRNGEYNKHQQKINSYRNELNFCQNRMSCPLLRLSNHRAGVKRERCVMDSSDTVQLFSNSKHIQAKRVAKLIALTLWSAW